NNWLTVFATIGIVMATAYSLRIMQKVFYEPGPNTPSFPDLTTREMAVALPMVAGILWLGLYPQPVLELARPAIQEQLQAYQPAEELTPIVLQQKVIEIQFTDTSYFHQTKGGAHEPK